MPSSRLVSLAITALSAAACAWLLVTARALAPSQVDSLLEAPPLPSSVTRRLALGFTSAVADLAYLQAVQVYGDKAFTMSEPEEKARRGKAIFRLIDYATDLDPAFAHAYVFGSVSIASARVDGTMQNLDEVLSILRKGTAAAKSDWRVPFHLAYYQSFFQGDFAAAAESMQETARRPGRPAYVPLLAARLAAVGGQLDTGIAFTRAMIANAPDDKQRADLEERVRLLVMEKHLRELEAAIVRYRSEHGDALPTSLDELVTSGILSGLPGEPHGGSYQLDAQTGEVSSTAGKRLRLPDKIRRDIDRSLRARPTPAPGPQP